MMRRIFCWIILIGLVFTAGCDLLVPPPAQESNLATAEALIKTIQSNEVISTVAQIPTWTETFAVIPTKPTSTLAAGSITITGIQEIGPGRVVVSWDAVGEFPSGFQIVWTDQQGKPTYPENTSAYIGDAYARSAMISGTVGKIYFVRVCRFLNASCDLYSDLGIFAFTNTLPTALITGGKTPTVLVPIKTKLPVKPTGTGETKIQITFMSGGSDGKAFMMWDATGTFPSGFKIVYSKTNSTPAVGTDSYFVIGDGLSRNAYVSGDPGNKYYYRICRVTATGCDTYSPVFAYIFAGTIYTPTPDPAVITITSIVNKSTGKATINWSATGTFPTGFKIVYSKTNPLPTLADTYVYITDGSLRMGEVTGDPSDSYYFRVCKYFDGRCVVYSPVSTFTFAAAPSPTPDGSTISNVNVTAGSVVGNATITWTATGVFPLGFKILSSTSNTVPTWENASASFYADSGAARSLAITGNPRTFYYYRICKYTGTGCGVYSNVATFTYPDAAVDTSFLLTNTAPTSGQVRLNWTLPVDNPTGYKVIYGFGDNPTIPENPSVFIEDRAARTYLLTSLGSGTTYFIRLCKFNGTLCTAYSNTISVDMP